MLASVFQSAGYKTGLYTSPHLKSFTERIRIDGAEVPATFVVDFVNRIHPLIESLHPSFFEVTVVMAFDYFARSAVDIAVIEVGLGGRLDSTNVILPELSVITNIGWDHQDLLGDTLEKIAGEKAGIIKAGIPVVVSERQPGLDNVFNARAKLTGSTLWFASDAYRAVRQDEEDKCLVDLYQGEEPLYRDLELDLRGGYQSRNVVGVVQSVDRLRNMGWTVTDEHLREGLRAVTTLTGLKGRWQVLGRRPLIVCDTGHNVAGIREVVDQIQSQQFRKLHMVFGMVRDKDAAPVLQLLPKQASYYFCQARLPRALDAVALTEKAKEFGLSGVTVPDVNAAIRAAMEQAGPEDMIFIGGSTFVVAEIENL
jgi:dihydrofolate synthase/folylpolyglutamate synthase